MLKFMQMAIAEAEQNLLTNDGGPFGAVVVKDGQAVATGHNEVLKNNDPTCHGEMQAIRAACQKLGTYDLTGCELYTSAYPCPMCLSAIIWANIKTVYYGNSAQDAEEIGFRDDFIYRFIKDDCQQREILTLKQLGRAVAQDSFQKYKQEHKTIY
ncbi:MAG: nucleoside deaminase [Acidaminococcaceae bacterium]